MSSRSRQLTRSLRRWPQPNYRNAKRRWQNYRRPTFILARRVCSACKASGRFPGIKEYLATDERRSKHGSKRLVAGGCRCCRGAAGVDVDGDVGRGFDGAVLSTNGRAGKKGESSRAVYGI